MKNKSIRMIVTLLVAGCACATLAAPFGNRDSQQLDLNSMVQTAGGLEVMSAPTVSTAPAPSAATPIAENQDLSAEGIPEASAEDSSAKCHKTFSDHVGTGTWPVCYGTPASC